MPLYLHRIAEKDQLGIWKIEETETELLNLLPEKAYYQKEILKFKTPHRIIEWLSVRALLFKIQGKHHPVLYHESGRPYLEDDNLSISISHTKGYVAVIVSDKTDVGIDIEHYAQRIHKVASKFMRADEPVDEYRGDTTWKLLLHWSAKETMFKSIDDEGIDFREHLHIMPFKTEEEGMFESREYKTSKQRIFKIHYLLNSDFVLTWQAE